MRISELTEYQLIPPQTFTSQDFSAGEKVGVVRTGMGLLDIWKLEAAHEIAYGAIGQTGPADPFGQLVFQEMSGGALIARNAWTKPGCEGKGIQSELFLFVNKVEQKKILSDSQLTVDGEKLWNSMIGSGKFQISVAYIPTGEIFGIDNIGKAKTSDGHDVISPKDDNFHPEFYDSKTEDGQRFFYLMEGKNSFEFLHEGVIYRFGVDRTKHIGDIVQPYRYFRDGDL